MHDSLRRSMIFGFYCIAWRRVIDVVLISYLSPSDVPWHRCVVVWRAQSLTHHSLLTTLGSFLFKVGKDH